jgi:hypothetical protein
MKRGVSPAQGVNCPASRPPPRRTGKNWLEAAIKASPSLMSNHFISKGSNMAKRLANGEIPVTRALAEGLAAAHILLLAFSPHPTLIATA